MARFGSEFYNVNFPFSSFYAVISVENMNMLPSSIYKHPKINLIKHKQSLILGVCGSEHISVYNDIYISFKAKRMLTFRIGRRRRNSNGNVRSDRINKQISENGI